MTDTPQLLLAHLAHFHLNDKVAARLPTFPLLRA